MKTLSQIYEERKHNTVLNDMELGNEYVALIDGMIEWVEDAMDRHSDIKMDKYDNGKITGLEICLMELKEQRNLIEQ